MFCVFVSIQETVLAILKESSVALVYVGRVGGKVFFSVDFPIVSDRVRERESESVRRPLTKSR